jgi:hypothetical protein
MPSTKQHRNQSTLKPQTQEALMALNLGSAIKLKDSK